MGQLRTLTLSNDRKGLLFVSGKSYAVSELLSVTQKWSPLRAVSMKCYNTTFIDCLPELYWYVPIFALLSTATARNGVQPRHGAGFCMMQNGDIFVCFLETRCSKPHYHIAVYHIERNKIVIYQDSWALGKFKLTPDVPLSVDVSIIEELVALYLLE